MYDRYAIYSQTEAIEKHFNAKFKGAHKANFNAAPCQLLPIITAESPEMIQHFYWGMPPQMANNKSLSTRLINLPGATAMAKPITRNLMISQRCVILADGFFVWKQLSKKQKVPYFCYLPNRQTIAIAGIWEKFDDLENYHSHTFNMLTHDSIGNMLSYQEDLPMILTKEELKVWLNTHTRREEIESIVSKKRFSDISLHAVNPLISDINLNSSKLIEPAPPSDQFGNYTLFS